MVELCAACCEPQSVHPGRLLRSNLAADFTVTSAASLRPAAPLDVSCAPKMPLRSPEVRKSEADQAPWRGSRDKGASAGGAGQRRSHLSEHRCRSDRHGATIAAPALISVRDSVLISAAARCAEFRLT